MDNDLKILVIAFIILLAISFLSFSFTGSFIRKGTRGFEDKELTEIWISNDGRNYVKDETIDIGFGKHIYFRVKTGDPFGTDALIKFFWYPDEFSDVLRDKVFKGSTYIPGCGKPSCRGGLLKEFRYLTLSLEKGLNCAIFRDRGFNQNIEVCFNII